MAKFIFKSSKTTSLHDKEEKGESERRVGWQREREGWVGREAVRPGERRRGLEGGLSGRADEILPEPRGIVRGCCN